MEEHEDLRACARDAIEIARLALDDGARAQFDAAKTMVAAAAVAQQALALGDQLRADLADLLLDEARTMRNAIEHLDAGDVVAARELLAAIAEPIERRIAGWGRQ